MVHRFIFGLLALSLLAPAAAAQTFDVQAYQEFLNASKNLTAAGLESGHRAPLFKGSPGANPLAASWLDSVRIKYNLTPDELALLARNGFVVTERLSFPTFAQAFGSVYKNDLPVLVTTDAILHALHKSYDEILKATERDVLNDRLETSLKNLYASWRSLEAQYGSRSDMRAMLNDIDMYVTVGLNLAGIAYPPNRFENAPAVNRILACVKALQPADILLFSGTPRTYDFSQMQPRGHYNDDGMLKEYFQAMIWLGRTEMMLSKPVTPGVGGPSEEDIRRQTVDAYLLHEAATRDSTLRMLNEMDSIIRFLVGESDNVTLDNLAMLKRETGFASVSDLLDAATLERFQQTLKTKSYAVQRINSQILLGDPFAPGSITPPSAFLLMGQRFVIDSYVMGSVVYDKIEHDGTKIFRGLPSALDPLFALGNDAAAQLLQDELNRYFYAPNLAALRYLVDSYEEEFWSSTLYNTWLSAIRKLHPPSSIGDLPPFMQTGAWWQEKMNTQLASWAQLRHDNLLYAKQSYTGGATCSFPAAYVEPFPDFYRTIGAFAKSASTRYATVAFFDKSRRDAIVGYFTRLREVTDTLGWVAEKELRGTPLTAQEIIFLKSLLTTRQQSGGCGPPVTVYDGWYPQLFFSADADMQNYIIADVHTQPTDAMGNMVGYVMHVGTGDVNLGIVTAPAPDGTLMAFTGPMLTYIEHVTSGFTRLTDEDWYKQKLYASPLSQRPGWVNVYLADKYGNALLPGPRLKTEEATGIPPDRPGATGTLALMPNYPNPVSGSSTTIGFVISHSSSPLPVRIAICDLNGREVRELLDDNLPAGSYFVRWDGTDGGGKAVAAGVYFCRLGSGTQGMVRKMVLIK